VLAAVVAQDSDGPRVRSALQVWQGGAFDLLDDAREALDERAYRAFVDILHRRVTRELMRVEFDLWRAAA
jgi:hypothetical protein